MESLSFGDHLGRTWWRILPKRAISGVIGWWARRPLGADAREPVLGDFARRFHIEASEAELPVSSYGSRNDFFTRRLKPGLRPIDGGADVVVNAADGRVVEVGRAEGGRLIPSKRAEFTLGQILADDELARRFEGGAYMVTYLSPRDYHRVHAPVAGRIVGWRHVPGTLFSVNDTSVRREPGLFGRNERLITLIDSPDAGLVAVVMVAAVGVGHITVTYDAAVSTHDAAFDRAGVRARTLDPAPPVAKGGELGTFHMGSTTVVVFEAGRVELDSQAPGTATQMGRRIGQIVRLPS